MIEIFDPEQIKRLYKPESDSDGEDNGQVTIVGGSKLFHGAPLFALKIASRIVDMVFFATPEPSVGRVAEQIKSKLFNFIWIDWGDAEAYIQKSEATLMGPGFMRFGSEKANKKDRESLSHQEGIMTRLITENFLKKIPNARWVIDGGSLQVMDADWIPEGAIITPNSKEFSILFKVDEKTFRNTSLEEREKIVSKEAKKHGCIIVSKGPKTLVCSPEKSVVVQNGNPGLTKGGTGDALSGLTVALLAKNDPFLAACAASYLIKRAADELYEKVGVNYNADDLTERVPETLHGLTK